MYFYQLHAVKDVMHSDTDHIVEHNRLALLRVLTGLFAMAGLKPGTESVSFLPRQVKFAILRVLRRAESAGRRLVFAKARRMEIPAYIPRERREKKARSQSGARRGSTRIPQFQLIDPRKVLEALYPNRQARRAARKRRTDTRLLFRFDSFDGQPACEAWSEAEPELSPDDPLNGVPLSRRLQALFHALSDLDKQAERMVREIAKRRAAKPGPKSVPPIRFGFAPGQRKKPDHEIDEILQTCQWLARREPVPPDRF